MIKTLKKISFENNEFRENSLNIGLIKGGTAMNVVPDYAEASVEIRSTADPNVILNKIKNELKDVELKIINLYEPVKNNAKDIVQKLNLEKKKVSYFTEMYFFNKKAKTIVIGAGREGYAHSENERVKIKDFNQLIEIYYKMIKEVQ